MENSASPHITPHHVIWLGKLYIIHPHPCWPGGTLPQHLFPSYHGNTLRHAYPSTWYYRDSGSDTSVMEEINDIYCLINRRQFLSFVICCIEYRPNSELSDLMPELLYRLLPTTQRYWGSVHYHCTHLFGESHCLRVNMSWWVNGTSSNPLGLRGRPTPRIIKRCLHLSLTRGGV